MSQAAPNPAQPPHAAARVSQVRLLAVLGWTGFALLLLVPAFASSRYIVYLGTLLALQATLAVSLNIVMGYAGQFALAHCAFYGLGAYVSAITIRDFGLGFWTSLPPTIAVAAAFAVLIGYPSLRFTGGIHFALITFAFGELLRLVVANLHDLTGGPQGMQIAYSPGVVLGFDFGSAKGLYALSAGLLAVALAIAAGVRHSGFGRSLLAIREDEVLAASLGVDITASKVAAFGLASILAALAGALYAPFIGFISPEMMSASDSISVVGMLIVGGMGTLSGPIFGTLIFMGVPELLRMAKLYRLVILGLIIVAVVLFAPKGVAGLTARWTSPKRGREA